MAASGQTQLASGITAGGRRFVVVWALGMVALFVIVGGAATLAQYRSRQSSLERHAARTDPTLPDPGVTAAETEPPANANSVKVQAGIYVDRVVQLSVKDATWTADFYVWFRWTGNDVNPGEKFQIVDGWIESKEKEDDFVRGDEHYERYRVVASITKSFDVSRVPCDDHLLMINVEDPARQRHELMFVADEANSRVSSRVKITGYEIHQIAALEKPHSYKTTRGDPRLKENSKSTYSQL